MTRRRRAAIADAVDADDTVQVEFDVQFGGAPAVAAVTQHSLWVVPLGADRAAMVAPAIRAITTVHLAPKGRRSELVVRTPAGYITLKARRRVAQQLLTALITHAEYTGGR